MFIASAPGLEPLEGDKSLITKIHLKSWFVIIFMFVETSDYFLYTF